MRTRKGQRNMWTPEKIKQLRKDYGERQEDFCQRLGVSLPALRHWEQGLGDPSGPARILLDRLAQDLREGRVKQPA